MPDQLPIKFIPDSLMDADLRKSFLFKIQMAIL